MRIYIDGVFDLYHRGHLESFKNIKSIAFSNSLNIKEKIILVVGIVSDDDSESYKRRPIIMEEDRIELIKYNTLVDEIIFPCPLVINKEFIDKNKIDLIVHGFSDPDDFKKQEHFFKIPIQLGKFKKMAYYNKTSTTDIIKKIKKL